MTRYALLVTALLCCALSFAASRSLQGLEPDQALRYFEMTADAYPESWAAWNGLGEAYMAKGDKRQAGRMYEKSLLLNPQNENARKMLRSLSAK